MKKKDEDEEEEEKKRRRLVCLCGRRMGGCLSRFLGSGQRREGLDGMVQLLQDCWTGGRVSGPCGS